MGMVVRSNIMAMNANRQLGINNNSVAKNLEKLSSGFKINRAGDDASGLAISEKMKAQIKGLETASANAQDGISLVQTAEGALTEVHDMLNRMVELATKSANGTIQDKVDREAIQSEVNALNDEINRISKSTNFNGINLLDGSLGSGKAAAMTGVVNGAAVTAGTEVAATNSSLDITVSWTDDTAQSVIIDGEKIEYTADTDDATSAAALKAAMDNNAKLAAKYDITITGDTITITNKVAGKADAPYAAQLSGTGGITTANATAGEDAKTTYDLSTFAAGDAITVGGKTYTYAAAADATANKFNTLAELKAQLKENGIAMDDTTATAVTFTKDDGGLTLQIGDTGDDFNMVTVSVGDMSAKGLGTEGLDVSNAASARGSIDTIKNAINTVSTNRADLGALQNRLEHTINNLDVAAENMSAANSRIRDTDMAKQMMEYTKMNVLTQAAQAMLAQANQQPQSILQLLR